MYLEVALLLSLLCGFVFADETTHDVPKKGVICSKNFCYFIQGKATYWGSANLACQDTYAHNTLSATLLYVADEETNRITQQLMEPYIKANLNASAWLTGGLFYNDKRGFQWAEPESQPATFTNWGRGFPDPSIKGYKYMVDPFSAVAQFAEVCKTPGAPGCQKIGKSGVEARFYWINTACNAELRYPICMIKNDGTFGQN